jgi:RimJ/RimL family protein N-acetyltransferase
VAPAEYVVRSEVVHRLQDSTIISLRELQRTDLPFLLGVRNSCRAMLHDDREFTLQEAEKWFDSAHPRFYLVALECRPIGYFRTSNWDDANRHVYVGCDLHESQRGKGYAQVAYDVFMRFLFNNCGINKVSLEVLSHNDRARKLYQKLGFVLEGVKRQEVWRDGRYLDSLMFSLLKSEFAVHCLAEHRA